MPKVYSLLYRELLSIEASSPKIFTTIQIYRKIFTTTQRILSIEADPARDDLLKLKLSQISALVYHRLL